MPKKLLKRIMPDHDTIRNHPHISRFGSFLIRPYLWHLHRRTAPGAVAVGLFFAWVPVPFQMVLAAIGAIVFRVNLPLSVVMVWVSNPITMPPLFYSAFLVGLWALGIPPQEFSFELSFEWLSHELAYIWKPFLFGCLLLGVISSLVGYLAISLLWRLHLLQYIQRRAKRNSKSR